MPIQSPLDHIRSNEFYLDMIPRSRLEGSAVVAPATSVFLVSETDPLRSVGMFGPMGLEVVLAKTLPEEVSLFFDDMDTLGARREFCMLALQYLQGPATSVIRHDQTRYPVEFAFESPVAVYNLKLGFADHLRKLHSLDSADFMIDSAPLSEENLLNRFKARAVSNLAKYDGRLQKRPDLDEIMNEARLVFCAEKDLFENIYQDKEVGRRVALATNFELAVKGKLPLCNLMYARDQAVVLYNYLYNSRMAHPIRQSEVDIMRIARATIGFDLGKYQEVVDPDSNATIEGGDFIPYKGSLLQGCNIRTNLHGVTRVASWVYEIFEKAGASIYALVIPRDDDFTANQKKMHADTFSQAVTDDTFAACESIASQAHVLEFSYAQGERARAAYTCLGSLANVLPASCYLPVSDEDQQNLNINLVLLDSGQPVVIAPVNGKSLDDVEFYRNIQQRLRSEYRAGSKIKPNLRPTPLRKITKGAGGPHCLTMQFARGNFVLERNSSAFNYAFSRAQLNSQIRYLAGLN